MLLKKLYEAKDKKRNNDLLNVIKSGLSDLKDEIKEMSEDEIKIEKPHKTVDTVEKILEFDRRNQEGQRLEILTPDQMLNRLPIFLVQLKAVKTSENLKNDMRQLLYSLYRSKKLTKTIYSSLINTI